MPVQEKTSGVSSKPALGSGHIRTLDGWRTIAVGAVIWYHAPQIPVRSLQAVQNFGIEGVALFFAISGSCGLPNFFAAKVRWLGSPVTVRTVRARAACESGVHAHSRRCEVLGVVSVEVAMVGGAVPGDIRVAAGAEDRESGTGVERWCGEVHQVVSDETKQANTSGVASRVLKPVSASWLIEQ